MRHECLEKRVCTLDSQNTIFHAGVWAQGLQRGMCVCELAKGICSLRILAEAKEVLIHLSGTVVPLRPQPHQSRTYTAISRKSDPLASLHLFSILLVPCRMHHRTLSALPCLGSAPTFLRWDQGRFREPPLEPATTRYPKMTSRNNEDESSKRCSQRECQNADNQ